MTGSLEDLLLTSPLRKDPRCEVRQVGASLYALSVAGRLPPGWCGHLSLGLAHAGVDIVWGSARKKDGGWEADFRLRNVAGGDPLLLDYVRLLKRGGSTDTDVSLRLTSYEIHTLPGALALEIRGIDCVGFLGSLLRRLAFLSLFPEEMRIETQDGEANDRFRLRSVAGRAPSDESRRALAEMLGDLARSPHTAPA
jgi:hypothetical protein